jgi:hypothetical protein
MEVQDQINDIFLIVAIARSQQMRVFLLSYPAAAKHAQIVGMLDTTK